MIISIDFDGTVVSHAYPFIGFDIGSVPVLKAIVDNGHKIILNTMRSHKKIKILEKEIDPLQEAIDWFNENGIALWAVNENPEQKEWTDSPKIYANLYIDDSALGCPLRLYNNGYVAVDWKRMENILKDLRIIKE